MSAAVLVLLGVTAVAGLALAAVGERARPGWAGVVVAVPLGTAALLAWPVEASGKLTQQAAVLLAVLAAVAGGLYTCDDADDVLAADAHVTFATTDNDNI
ncbi:hypothetical protein [Geodermatophilus chilensis]|uniref:hypothetical protein n=1 Tax=Geodermatophilus chilensis TaxID=2035835 RepID=UPI000C262C0C|nr:hypothetical protein [Geodermatophilus chilensis]